MALTIVEQLEFCPTLAKENPIKICTDIPMVACGYSLCRELVALSLNDQFKGFV